MEFLLDKVMVKTLNDDSMVAIGKANHETRLYCFSHFVPKLTSLSLLTHSNSQSKLWHERFGHLNYCYLQQLSNKDMIIGLPQVKYSEGVCPGCEVGKHPKEKYDKEKSWKETFVLELVHGDVVGPFLVPSFHKACYVLIFIDDFS